MTDEQNIPKGKEIHKNYGVVFLNEKKETVVLKVIDFKKEIIKIFESPPRRPQQKGGRSHLRFKRIVEEKFHKYVENLVNLLNENFLKNGEPIVDQIIFKESKRCYDKVKLLLIDQLGMILVHKEDYLDGEIGIIIDENKEKEKLEKIFLDIVKMPNRTTYGYKNVIKCLELNIVNKILISENLKDVKDIFDTTLEFKKEFSLFDNIINYCNDHEIFFEILNGLTNENTQFIQSLQGIGAYLKEDFETKDEEISNWNLLKGLFI